MYCNVCGALIDGQNYCGRCGRPVTAAPVLERRVAAHLRTLSILWLVRGILLAIPGLFMMLFRSVRWGLAEHFILTGLGVVLLAGATLCLIAAWALSEREPWARMYTVVLGAISLFEVPFGTAIGVYSLWVLLPQSSETEYRRLAMQ